MDLIDILKHVPLGTRLRTPLYDGDVILKEINIANNTIKVVPETNDNDSFFLIFDSEGKYFPFSKCLLFPKFGWSWKKFAENIEKEKYKPNIGDRVIARDGNKSEWIRGVLVEIKDSIYPYVVEYTYREGFMQCLKDFDEEKEKED